MSLIYLSASSGIRARFLSLTALINLEARFPSLETRNFYLFFFFEKKFQLITIGRSRNKNKAYLDFAVEARPSMRSFTQQHEQQVMEGRMGSLEQAVQALTARMTEVFEMLSARDRRDAVENGRRRLRAGEGEEFLAYKEEASKRMEEIRKRMESFFPPRTSPTSQSLPITGESNAGSVGTNFMPHIINIKPTEDVTMSPEFSGDNSSPDGRVVKEGVAGILVAASPEGAENIMGVLQ